METTLNMKALFMIVNAGFAEEVIELTRKVGVRGATILNARGEDAKHESFLGITVDTEKEVIFSITDECTAEKAMAIAKEKAGIQTPVHGIFFTMSVEKAVGLDAVGSEDEE